MQERIIDIIVYLLGQFQKEPARESYTDFSKELISKGYTKNEINLAFSWVFNHLQSEHSGNKQELHYFDEGVRVLHDLEKLVISAEAYGYILQLYHLGLLAESDIEIIIERALALGTMDVTLEDIKSLIASVIFGVETSNSFDGFLFHQGTNTIH
jgi:uncharacterized protein Smg (DUF494 family)